MLLIDPIEGLIVRLFSYKKQLIIENLSDDKPHKECYANRLYNYYKFGPDNDQGEEDKFHTQ